MPYIPVPERKFLDVGNAGSNVGELTYSIQQELLRYLEGKMLEPGGVHYADLAECLAALEGAKADFIDRILMPYEHRKRAENGDVWHSGIMTHLDIA